MSRTVGRRRRIKQETPNPCAIHQLERQVKRNRFAPILALEAEQVELIHAASMAYSNNWVSKLWGNKP